jgi:hypothetical protein
MEWEWGVGSGGEIFILGGGACAMTPNRWLLRDTGHQS